MALFKRSYRDTLRELKKEAKTIEENTTEINKDAPYDPFAQTTVDLSHEYSEITNAELYKKYHRKYTISNETKIKQHVNMFEDIPDLIPSFFTESSLVINDDFLTGYYLAKFHIKLPQILTSFHAGMSSDGLIRGIYHGLFQTSKKYEWSLYGCDKNTIESYNKLYINGIHKPCDIYNQNTANSINIQLSAKFKTKTFDLYTVDICPSTAMDILRAYILLIDYISDAGTIIIRIPTNWKSFYTPMLNIITMFTHLYTTVKIFNAVWADTRKYYLILSNAKDIISTKLITNLRSYINCGDDNMSLVVKAFMDEYADHVDKIKNVYEKFSTEVLYPNIDDNITKWADMMSN